MVWDGYYAIGEITFGITTDAARQRNINIGIEHNTVNDLNKLIERIKNEYGKNFTNK
jgi:low affinity Fe/Cu permease